ncbi:MAG: polysaccharide deacetylase family protein [Candidatus Velthaea sp.]
MQTRFFPRLAAFAGLALVLAGCGGGSNSGQTPLDRTTLRAAGARTVATKAAQSHKNLQKAPLGVSSALFAGWAAHHLETEHLRRAHQSRDGKHGDTSESGDNRGNGGNGDHRGNGGNSDKGNGPGANRGNPQSVPGTSLGSATTLVLYDTAGQWGYLGELYAMAVANLAGHFGTVTTKAVSSYSAGDVNAYTATIYIGSTYYDASTDLIPKTFYADVLAGSRPVIWMNDNIWNFANAVGVANFNNRYGWDPTTSYFAPNGNVGNVTQVNYKSKPLTRTIPSGADGGVLHPNVLGGTFPAVSVLAQAVDAGTSPATIFPYAVRSANLTYIGEIPFDYVNESSRLIALEDLLFDALAPATPTNHTALLRLEDISPLSDPVQLRAVATYLANANIPYGFNIIPRYEDPLGFYNNGTPVSQTLASTPDLVNVIRYMLAHGGTMVAEGYTHQYMSARNPYNGVTGDDAEFFLAHVDTTDHVIWDGPVPQDSQSWAAGRVASSIAAFQTARLPVPNLWVTPHYFASEVDYRAISASFSARYERSIYFKGLLSGSIDHTQFIGQFFPYVVRDVYGTKVLPENLGDYEPVSLNHNPVRLPADLVNEAVLNLAVRNGIASFFYDPSNDLAPLQQTVTGLQGAGYTFISPASL